MQTFLPYSDFRECARILDNKRLNKQIIEAYQLYTGRVPQKNHPACLMWEKHKGALPMYLGMMCVEYMSRFNKPHSVVEKVFAVHGDDVHFYLSLWERPVPLFARNTLVNLSHCVNLIRKDPDFYGPQLGNRVDFLSTFMYNRNFDINEFPEGYYWPIEPVGKKAKQDRENWLNFK